MVGRAPSPSAGSSSVWIAQRARLFLRWFNGAEQQKHYIIRTAEIKGEGQAKEYVAFIAQRTNPNINLFLQYFENEIAMFNEQKP